MALRTAGNGGVLVSRDLTDSELEGDLGGYLRRGDGIGLKGEGDLGTRSQLLEGRKDGDRVKGVWRAAAADTKLFRSLHLASESI